MMTTSRLESLSAKHRNLENKLAAELRRPIPDAALVSDIKKEKLRIKEAMGQTS